MRLQDYQEKYMPSVENLVPYLTDWGSKIFFALLTVYIGFKVVWYLQKAFKKLMDLREYDPMVESFLSSLVGGLLKIMIFISAAWVLWVKTDSFIAMLAAAGFAIGMALSGTLQNFASWLIIVMFKPFKIGDYIDVAGQAWTVSGIQIFNTIMLTTDKKTIVMPNSQITGSSLVNYSEQANRRVDMEIWIGYSDDIALAKKLLQKIADWDERIDAEKDITIWVKELWDNSVIIAFRFYVESADYWAVWFDVTEKIKLTFDKKWVSFPFPQRDVHLYNEK